jgi:hypothetical protein
MSCSKTSLASRFFSRRGRRWRCLEQSTPGYCVAQLLDYRLVERFFGGQFGAEIFDVLLRFVDSFLLLFKVPSRLIAGGWLIGQKASSWLFK